MMPAPHSDINTAPSHSVISNAALICDFEESDFLEQALALLEPASPILWVANQPLSTLNLSITRQLDFAQVQLEAVPLNLQIIQQSLLEEIRRTGPNTQLVVDMAWGAGSVSAFANFEWWGMLCDNLQSETQRPIVSLYNRRILIEDQLLAALRGHAQFLSPQGTHPNPFWLPPELLHDASLDTQVDFFLGQIMPDYQYQVPGGSNHHAAIGANPEWIRPPRRIRPLRGADTRWKIRCFGQLRIYTANSELINWQIAGSAPKKTRALFAYLLQRGEQGASAERIAEFLWPQEDNEVTKRSRLHHCIAMLRKTLGGKDFLQRNGNYYQLLPPAGSWIDVASFEQLCRQSKMMASAGNSDEALTLLRAAERLYTGDLFEDLLPEYVESEMEDWCLPQRQWFREMAIKVYRDLAALLRDKKQFKEAMNCCHKALEMDAANEMIHAEAMRIFYEQSRIDAVERQYRQYLAALSILGIAQPTKVMQQLLKQMTVSD